MAAAIDPLMSSPRSRPKDKGFRLDQVQLEAKIKQVVSRYGLKEEILDDDIDEKVRCKYVFVAGAVQKDKEQDQDYHLFRTYKPEKGRSGRTGPDPKSCKVWDAISATGAAKHFLKPYRFGRTTYFDENVPTPHPISRLALEEAQHLFGDKVPISIILNIGPGIPGDQDVQQLEQSAEGRITKLVRTFSWPNKKSLKQLLRRDTQVSSKSASDLEQGLEARIRTKLQEVYGPDGAERYYHLGPDFAASQLSLNDVSAIERTSESTREVLASSKGKIQDAARQYWVSTAC
ncbi:hypothetical protein H2200_003357 [Cladophialophora chaetospira]|uniref:Uncharacterized protein n=1 Tax=Cladophialophora chaetospira TaxID=386627 RepID=A0AA39CM73_9EURO|nr:hypothetical protein H2200_003357 [Cladophialophora chaetospira]